MARPEIDDLMNFSERSAKQSLAMQIGTFTGEYHVTIKPVKPSRTGRQNRFLFGVVYRLFREFMREQGESVTTEEAHEFFKVRFGLRRQMHDPATGELVELIRSSTTYDPGEMGTYIDLVSAFLDELGVVVPPPGDYGVSTAPVRGEGVRC